MASGSETRQLNKKVDVRVTEEIRELFQAAAEASSPPLSVGAWLRMLGLDAIDQSEFEPPRSKPRHRVRLPDADLAEVSKMAATIARLNGAVVQLSKSERKEGGSYHRDLETELVKLRIAQKELVELIAKLKKSLIKERA